MQRSGVALGRGRQLSPHNATLAPPVRTPTVVEKKWKWNDHQIRYKTAGNEGPSVVLIHGFGGNCDHFRKNIPYLAEHCKVYSIDLLGYGYSDKPDPHLGNNRDLYTFEKWSEQIADFTQNVVQEPSFLICNSIGGVVGLQTAFSSPEFVKGVQVMNISMRNLNIRKQPKLAKPFIRAFQDLLFYTKAGTFFYDQVARPETVRRILKRAYHDPNAVTDELVDLILKPGLEPGAAKVFLAFVSYSEGPLPEDLLSCVTQPVSILWGTEDPWERAEKGRSLAEFPSVEEFIELPEAGHCVMCEKSEIVNPLIRNFIFRHA